jgi:cobalamin biosynthesis protein CobT
MSKQHAEANHRWVLSDNIPGMGATKANLLRLLRSVDLVGWSTHEESGRIDRRALTRFASGSTSIFSRREYKEADTASVSVLVDCSSSMHTVASEVETILIHLAKILSQSKADFAVTGFRSGVEEEVMITNRSTGEKSYRFTERPQFIPFKQWGESYQRAVPKLGAFRQCISGSTPDYSSIHNSLTDLSRQPGKRKILFLLTDADGYVTDWMRDLQQLADRLGILLIAIGIQADSVTKCFTNAVNVKKSSEIASTSFNHLLRTLEKRRAA